MDEAVRICRDAAAAGITVRLAGGLAVQYLTPGLPPRGGDRQDLDLAIAARDRRPLTAFLTERGYAADRNFNALYGHKQLYFQSERTGRSLDVLVDRLHMCHTVEFADRLDRMPVTLDVTDLLLTKLQIVELNAKDAQDVLYLCSVFPVREGDEPGSIGLGRIIPLIAGDWGWWRTVTMNVDRIIALAEGAPGRSKQADAPREPSAEATARWVPPSVAHDPVSQLHTLRAAADSAPKSLRWKARAKVGDRVRWYEVPEEIPHD